MHTTGGRAHGPRDLMSDGAELGDNPLSRWGWWQAAVSWVRLTRKACLRSGCVSAAPPTQTSPCVEGCRKYPRSPLPPGDAKEFMTHSRIQQAALGTASRAGGQC